MRKSIDGLAALVQQNFKLDPFSNSLFLFLYSRFKTAKVQTNGLSANSDAVTDNAVYEYYPDGKLKKITYPKLNDGTYLTTEYVYNALGRMTSIINKKGSTVLSQYQYTYDANGNIITVNNGQTVTTYGYDKLNRLVEIQPQLGSSTLYTYDLRGNRLTLNSTSLNYVDASYSYDLENKLQTVTKGGLTTTMKYSADGLRTKKESAYGYTNYIYNQSGNLVAEAQNSSSVTSNYVWGPDRVLSKKTNSGSEYYYLYNGHGDVVQMVDRNGNVVNNYTYDEWGNITASNETVSNPFKYAGEVYDSETGLYYLKARYYDPSIGRFINEDTVEGQVDNPISLNLYSYCWNNPLIYIDPTGNTVYTIKTDVKDRDGHKLYNVYLEERLVDGTFIALGFIPLVSLTNELAHWLIGAKEINISKKDVNKLVSFLNKIKDNEYLNISTSLISDYTWLTENFEELKKLGKLGKAVSNIGTIFSIIDAGMFILDESYIIESIVYWKFYDSLYSRTREGVELKYLYAYGEVAKLISNGTVKYEVDSLGFVSIDYFPYSEAEAIEDVLDLMD